MKRILSYVLVIAMLLSWNVITAEAAAATKEIAPSFDSSDSDADIESYIHDLYKAGFEVPLNQLLYSKDGLKITATRVFVDNTFSGEGLSYDLELRVENKSSADVELYGSTIRIGGYEMRANFYETINSGTNGTATTEIDVYSLSYTEINEIKAIDLSLNITDSEYNTIDEIGYQTILLPQPLKVISRFYRPTVLWEDQGLKISLIGSGAKLFTEANGKKTRTYVFYLLKENKTDSPKIRFELDFRDHYVNGEVLDYAHEPRMMYLPTNGKELSRIKIIDLPTVKENRTFEFTMVAVFGYSDILKGVATIQTNEEDEIVSAKGSFEKLKGYETYEVFLKQ